MVQKNWYDANGNAITRIVAGNTYNQTYDADCEAPRSEAEFGTSEALVDAEDAGSVCSGCSLPQRF